MRLPVLTLIFALLGAWPALAHPGHLAEVAGHNHWLAGAALGAAAAIALWAALKGKGKSEAEATEEAAEEADEEPQEA